MSEQPIDPLGKVTETTDLLGKIRGFLGGFLGYVERDQRREADKMLRGVIAQRFEEQWSRVSEVQRMLIAEGKLAYVDDVEAGAVRLRTFIDRVKTASYGYAGLFDHARIGEDELTRLYEYDLQMLEGADDLQASVDRLEAAVGAEEEELKFAIRGLQDLTRDLIETYDRRKDLLLTA